MSYPSKSGRLGSGISSGIKINSSKQLYHSGLVTRSSDISSGIPTGGFENLNPNAMKYMKGRVSEKQFEKLPSQSFPDRDFTSDDVSEKDLSDSKCCDCCVIQ